MVEDNKRCAHCREALIRRATESSTDFAQRKFCNRSCAAARNNKLHPKRKKRVGPREAQIRRGKCKTCKQRFAHVTTAFRTRELCFECRSGDFSALTKGEAFRKRSSWQSARTGIQKHARKAYESSGEPLRCFCCGYDRHVDIAHVRPVADFPDDALVSAINDVSNLRALCPNHHWEFDHDVLSLETLSESVARARRSETPT